MPQIDPIVERLVNYAENNGYLRSENRHIAGEARAFEAKLNDTERTLNWTTSDKQYLQDELTRAEAELVTLQKKLPKKPIKKVVKTKKGKK